VQSAKQEAKKKAKKEKAKKKAKTVSLTQDYDPEKECKLIHKCNWKTLPKMHFELFAGGKGRSKRTT
jgi:hypothetical protein